MGIFCGAGPGVMIMAAGFSWERVSAEFPGFNQFFPAWDGWVSRKFFHGVSFTSLCHNIRSTGSVKGADCVSNKASAT